MTAAGILGAPGGCAIPGGVSGRDDKGDGGRGRQLPLPLKERRAAPEPEPRMLRVIKGEGQKRVEALQSRDDVARVLVGAACDLMLRRITPDRAHEIQRRVDRIMRLFERVPKDPVATALLRRELDELEGIYRDGPQKRVKR